MTEMIHGVAVDAGSGLEATIRDLRGPRARPDDLLTFKRAVLECLGPEATTVLVDAALGPDLLPYYPAGCAPMLAFEADVYHISDADRITVLPDNFTVEDYPSMGVGQLKFFIYYAPDDDPALNAKKEALVEKIGSRCKAKGLRFLMEPLVYHPSVPPGSAEYAALKPEMVRKATALFAQERFSADVLKVEIPVDLDFVDGFGAAQMSRDEALQAFRDAGHAAGDTELVFLSAGVTFARFEASLHMAVEAGVDLSGFMCGRAIWSDGVGIFGAAGESALRDWLAETGRTRLTRLIAAIKGKTP